MWGGVAVASGKWVKFHFWVNYLFNHDKTGNNVSKLPNLRTKREVWPLEFVDGCSVEVITHTDEIWFWVMWFNVKSFVCFFGIDKNLIMDLRNNSRFFSNDGLAAVKRLAQHCYEMIELDFA